MDWSKYLKSSEEREEYRLARSELPLWKKIAEPVVVFAGIFTAGVALAELAEENEGVGVVVAGALTVAGIAAAIINRRRHQYESEPDS